MTADELLDGKMPARTAADDLLDIPVGGLKLDPYQQSKLDRTPQDPQAMTDDFVRALVNDPALGIDRNNLLSVPLAPFTAAGTVLNAGAQDVGAVIGGNPEGFGNLKAVANEEPQPYLKTLADVSKEHPAIATAGKVASGLVQTTPLIAAGLLGRLVSLGFSADMIAGAADASKQLGEEMGKAPEDRDADKVTSAVSSLIQSGAFAPLAGAHGLKPGVTGELALQLLKDPERYPAQKEPLPIVRTASSMADSILDGNETKAAPNETAPPVSETVSPPSETVKPVLKPALLIAGNPVTGGDTHKAIYDGLLKAAQTDDDRVAAHEAMLNDAAHVFVDQTGQVYDRQQAADVLGLKEPLHSEKLKEVQAAPTPEEVATKTGDEIGYKFVPGRQVGSVKLESLGDLTPEQRAELAALVPVQWEFTNQKNGRTFYVPEGSPRDAIIARANEKNLEESKSSPPPEPPIAAPTPPIAEPVAPTSESPAAGEVKSDLRNGKIPTPQDLEVLTPEEKSDLISIYDALMNRGKIGALNTERLSELESKINGEPHVESSHQIESVPEVTPIPNHQSNSIKRQIEALEKQRLAEVAKPRKTSKQVQVGRLLNSQIQSKIDALKSLGQTEISPVEPIPETNPKPALIGMGAAVPSEFEKTQQSPTATKNATIERERAARGLPPAIEPAKRSFGRVWDEAMAAIDQDPAIQDNLIASLSENPRAVTDAENALLLHRQIELQNSYGKLTQELAQAYDDSKQFPNRLDDVGDLKARVAAVKDQLFNLYELNKKVGTETGRGLNARKMMAYEDYTLAKMEIDARIENDGKPLTDEQQAEVKKLHETIADLQSKVDAYEAASNQIESEKEADEAIDQAKKDVEPVEPHVRLIANRVKDYFDARATAAQKRLAGKTFSFEAALPDLIDLGVSTILSGAADFTVWSSKMLEKLDKSIEPHLRNLWDKSNNALENHIKKQMAPQNAPKVKRVLKTAPIEVRQAEAEKSIRSKFKSGKKDEVSGQVQKLVRLFVEQGVIERDALIDAVHGVLVKIDPAITRREAMDAISGYGDYRQLSKDDISLKVRDLKGQMQQVAKLEDIQSKKPPLKTGVERRTPSDEERRLIQQVNEAKRRFGVVVTDPATQLRGVLEARKTYYENQISDLEAQIIARQKFIKTRTPSPTDAELEALKSRRDDLKRQFDDVFGKTKLSDAQKLKRLESGLDKRIEEVERQLKTGEIFPKGKKPSTLPVNDQIKAKQVQLDELKAQRQWAREASQPLPERDAEAIALKSLKTRMQNQINEFEQKLKDKDYAPKPKRLPVKFDKAANELFYQLDKAKRAWHEAMMRARIANRKIPAKVLGATMEAMNTMRAVMTSMDLSAVLRQGGFVAFGHPVRAAKVFPSMFKALRSEAGQHAVMTEIQNRPNYPLYVRSKLYLSEHGQKLSQMEEAYMSRWADKIPLVAASQRAYVTFLNRLRADSFDAMANTLTRDGEITPTEANTISNFVNVSTGRGNLGMKENALVGLNTIFFAPRYVASRFQLLGLQPLYRGNARTRMLVGKEYARFLIGASVVYGLASLAGAQIESDPRSSDFGKLKFGNTRIDPLFGLLQNTVFLTRFASGQTKKQTGQIAPAKSSDITINFLRNKLAPTIGLIFDLRDILTGQKAPVGHGQTVPQALSNVVFPLGFQDIYSAMKEQGVPEGTIMAILSLFGMGLQTQTPQPNKQTQLSQ